MKFIRSHYFHLFYIKEHWLIHIPFSKSVFTMCGRTHGQMVNKMTRFSENVPQHKLMSKNLTNHKILNQAPVSKSVN